MAQMMIPQHEMSIFSNMVAPNSCFFKNLKDIENSSVFCIKNKQVMMLSALEKLWNSIGASPRYHAQLVVLPGRNDCLVVGGSNDVDGFDATEKVHLYNAT